MNTKKNIKKNIKVSFDEENFKFLEWIANYFGVSVDDELQLMFHTEFYSLKVDFAEEYNKANQKKRD